MLADTTMDGLADSIDFFNIKLTYLYVAQKSIQLFHEVGAIC
jgi:hypothetical protein